MNALSLLLVLPDTELAPLRALRYLFAMKTVHIKMLLKIVVTAASLSVFLVPPSALALPRSLTELEDIPDALTQTGIGHGDIPSINNYAVLPMNEALMSLEPDDPVFIVPLPDAVHIYPQKVLVWHEVVNEVIKGEPYCISYSPLSGSLAVYYARAEQQNLIFDADGRLFNSNTTLIDRNTGSLWSQIWGMAFDGPLKGTGLDILPCYWTRWKYAREVYREKENVKVMQTPRGGFRNYNRDPYGSYLIPGDNYYNDERILYPLQRLDSRMYPKTQVIGLEVDKNLIGIDINYVRKRKVVNFFSGLVPLVAIHDEKLDVARIFVRSIWDGRPPALFTWKDGQIQDIMTRSIWNAQGQCVQGNLQGAFMTEKFGIYAFWFAWAAANPETDTVPGASVVPDSALEFGNMAGKVLP
ncbi:MAG: hypothetical protein DBY37_13040 [Desulfovibrionaceae bacterium]|nr:MAG: hypothetical protein DBY37_13040 [Desulfovibrionaceae bacterium]